MDVDLVCFATFVKEDTCDYTKTTRYNLPAGSTVADLATHVGIALDEIKIAFVNRSIVSLDTPLTEGDRVGLTPAVGGM